MKAKLINRIAIILCISSGLFFYSCKKDSATASTETTRSANVATAGDDESQVSTETEAVTDDANTALNSQASFSGDASSSVSSTGNVEVNSVGSNQQGSAQFILNGLICDATVTYDTANNQRIITIVYNGTNCRGNRIRTGTVVVTLPYGQHWKDAGATATIDVEQLKITRVSDGKSIIINGSKTYTNVSGGLLKDLSTLGTITHTVTSPGISITFNNGQQRTWQISKQRVFTYDNGIVITTTGTYSDGTDNDIAEWGTNRFGEAFKSLITEPKVFRQDCDFRLTSGQNTVKTDKGTAVITYGLDVNGNPTGCPGSGTYYFRLVWKGVNGKTFTVILPY